MSVAHFKLEIFRSFDDGLKVIWSRLERGGDYYVFQKFNWVKHWQNTIGVADGISPFIVVAFEGEEPLALFPLCLDRDFGIRVIKFLGGDQCDFNSPILLSDRITADGFGRMWDSILKLLPPHDVRLFTRVPEKLGRNNNLFLTHADNRTLDGIAYFTDLAPSWSDFSGRVSKRLLRDNIRLVRKMSECGEVQIVEATSSNLYQKIIKTTILQKTRRYLETGVRNPLSKGAVRKFYTGLYAAIKNDPGVHLTALMVGRRVVATHLGVYDRGRYYYLLPSFESGRFSKFSPGRVLLEYLVRSAIERGLDVFDFTVGGEAYKQKWCNSEMRLYRVLAVETSLGFMYALCQRLFCWAKRNKYARSFLISGVLFWRKAWVQNEKKS